MKAYPDQGKIRVFNAVTGREEETGKVLKPEAEWKKLLTPEQFRVTREKGTERPFSKSCAIPPRTPGVFACVACGLDLFLVQTKFESGTGWPSFWEPVSELNITEQIDESHGMVRTEVLCRRCDSHLGHVFNDGPPPTGKRYCINGLALVFKPLKDPKQEESRKATFAAGCFWGVEARFAGVPGVRKTTVGYTGGTTADPTYKDVCTGATGHAEAVELEYDPAVVPYEELLAVFWDMIDPTTPDRQGPDIGSQYRSAIFYHSREQKDAALASLQELRQSGKYKEPIVTAIEPAKVFYPAEEYHQKYYEKHGMKPACRLP